MHEGGDEALIAGTAVLGTEYHRGIGTRGEPHECDANALSGMPRTGRFDSEPTKHSWDQYASLGTSVIPGTRYGSALHRVDSGRISNKFQWLRVIFSAHCGRTLWAIGLTSAAVEALQAGGVTPLPRSNAGQSDVERKVARRALGPRSRCRGEHTLATADGYRPGSGAWSTRVCISGNCAFSLAHEPHRAATDT